MGFWDNVVVKYTTRGLAGLAILGGLALLCNRNCSDGKTYDVSDVANSNQIIQYNVLDLKKSPVCPTIDGNKGLRIYCHEFDGFDSDGYPINYRLTRAPKGAQVTYKHPKQIGGDPTIKSVKSQ